MPEYKLTWVSQESKYTSSNDLYLGKWKIGSVYYTGSQPKNSPQIIAICLLPGIKKELGYFKNEDDAIKKIHYAVDYWLERLNQDAPCPTK